MAHTPTVAMSLLQAGLFMGTLLLARIVAGHHVPAETFPSELRPRVELWNRLCPRLLPAALAMAGTGLVLHLLS